MNLNNQGFIRWKRIAQLSLGMLFIASFYNACAPTLFEAAKGGISGAMNFFSVFDKPQSPIVLMTSEQTFQSMLNVTGQTNAATGTQRAEFDSRTGSLSATDNLANMNSPLLLASTSLAGEVCNGLIAKETPMANGSRAVFGSVNFSANIATNGLAAYNSAVQAMALKFWGRNINGEELTALQSYYNEFVTGITDSTAQNRALYLSTCAAMLSSFDSLVY